ncbi:MAG: hypothetical protein H0U28_06430, partial [Nocardioidaceae bacterium]|nr:hypothetical protein [Nocardioidaceae bacterium]
TRWLASVPAQVRTPLVLRHPTIDLDASDIEVYGRTKQQIGWTYAGMRAGRACQRCCVRARPLVG